MCVYYGIRILLDVVKRRRRLRYKYSRELVCDLLLYMCDFFLVNRDGVKEKINSVKNINKCVVVIYVS